MSGLLFLLCLILLCVSVSLAVQVFSKNDSTLETQQNLTRMLQDVNQKGNCLRDILLQGQSSKCPQGWILVNGKCYFLSTDRKTREDSEQFCAENGAVLATVTSKESTLKGHIQSQKMAFWVGLQQKVTWTGDVAITLWVWSDDTTEPPPSPPLTSKIYTPKPIKPSVNCSRKASPAGYTIKCPRGWMLINQKCYFFSTDKKSKKDSEDFCADNGAVLGTVGHRDSILKVECSKS
ncbi:C-type lectin domain family 9 member A-like [Pyxicephalus adspersus]|uniref:C-type lectin domain family 9 member A-like n=1 Tax=Pyxicephalus adspersus TaxID=30357 RepID=UPI003B5B6190